ncbi:ornithine carbamoyltransferase [Vallitalea sp.]|jgi:ornithine carbamoyltransferase|uniref:ornithine carbamoyltransferase n=1 Tax=Vallitalea sp. TaxID=1882829 RepID=UPI0025DE2E4D|nr:ornithine carbamoyltransferase [Vallitalea sp.]MCT4687245.1 ornithine carbamoyltransferase [Vallitalea sp.]
MAFNLKGRHLLSLEDYSKKEIEYLIDLASELKRQKYAGIRPKNLDGKNIALIFEKPSTRTRCAFVTAAADEGAHPEYLGKGDIQLGKKESVADTARVLGRMFDGIQFRGFSHNTVSDLAKYAGVPVWNGLTDKFHPTQVLADFLTIFEHIGYLKGIKFAYVGDGRNNMANSLMIGASKMGMDFRIVSPKELFPEQELVTKAEVYANESGASITVTDSIEEGISDVDVIYTDVWVSMGEEEYFEERIKMLKPYQVNMNMVNMANSEVIFMHCLPAFHDLKTTVGKEIEKKYGISEMEVTDEVFESKYSVVFDEAENRMHTIKAVMVATL